MTTSTIERLVFQAIAEETNTPIESITADSRLYDDIPMDSLEMVEIVMRLEEEFDIEVSDETLSAKMTVGDIVAVITELAS